jgi:hypothetical protein
MTGPTYTTIAEPTMPTIVVDGFEHVPLAVVSTGCRRFARFDPARPGEAEIRMVWRTEAAEHGLDADESLIRFAWSKSAEQAQADHVRWARNVATWAAEDEAGDNGAE